MRLGNKFRTSTVPMAKIETKKEVIETKIETMKIKSNEIVIKTYKL